MSPEELRSTIEEQKTTRDVEKHPQELFSWQAPIRPYKRKTAGVLRFYLAVAVLLTLLVYFFGDLILVLPIWSTVFVVYVLTVTAPSMVTYRITKFGIEIAGITYHWDDLSSYYITRRFDYGVITITGQPQSGLFVYLVLPSNEVKTQVTSILNEKLVYLAEPQPSLTDRMAHWLTSLMPDEEAPRADLSKTEA